MCGIYGTIHHQKVDTSALRNQLNKHLIHRGPNDQQDTNWPGVYFYHARLAIQDITSGTQPMSYGPYTIIFNGEIYNHHQLRHTFQLNCKTRSDTETILHLYSRLGLGCLEYLDGMFAFAMYDEQNQKIILARDRAGEKPLYYHFSSTSFSFSSELNALYACVTEQPSVDESSINSFLNQGFLCGAETPYTQIKELPPGHILVLDKHNLDHTLSSYWSHTFSVEEKIDKEQEALASIDEKLETEVGNLVSTSDLEVGTFLSGGIDSSLVTAFATRFKSNIQSFTVCFEGAYNEGPLAKETAKYLGTRHHELHISFGNLTSDIFTILGAYGEPFADDSAIPSWYVCQAAKKYLTVVLTGDGADELFGGYRRYVPQRYLDIYRNSGNWLSKWGANITKGFGNEKKNYLNYLHRLLDSLHRPPLQTYLSSTTDIFTGYESIAFKKEIASAYLDEIIEQALSLSNSSPLDRALWLDFNILLPSVLLPKMDIASMQHSLETRTPFLAKDVIEFSSTLSPKLKIKGKQTKYLLRQLATKYLPKSIVNQPKRGFEIPLKSWMNSVLYPIVADLINSQNALSKDYIKKDYLNSLLTNRVEGLHEEKRAKQLFTLLALEIWWQESKKLR